MPNLTTYYKSRTTKERKHFNRQLFAELDIPYPTFYRKLRENRFTVSEQIAISQMLAMERAELFATEPAL